MVMSVLPFVKTWLSATALQHLFARMQQLGKFQTIMVLHAQPLALIKINALTLLLFAKLLLYLSFPVVTVETVQRLVPQIICAIILKHLSASLHLIPSYQIMMEINALQSAMISKIASIKLLFAKRLLLEKSRITMEKNALRHAMI
jgi:hypothetical protein